MPRETVYIIRQSFDGKAMLIGLSAGTWRLEILYCDGAYQCLESMLSVFDDVEFKYTDKFNDSMSIELGADGIQICVHMSGARSISMDMPLDEYKVLVQNAHDHVLNCPADNVHDMVTVSDFYDRKI